MRITGGTHRGRKLTPLKGAGDIIRPTSDRVREALFNIVGDRVNQAKVLDIFAGTGAFGIEALSRGADFSVFIDQSRAAQQIIRTNLLTCFEKPRALILLGSLPSPAPFSKLTAKLPEHTAFDLIFLDPPYKKKLAEQTVKLVEQTQLLTSDTLVIVEEHSSVALADQLGALQLRDQRKYGETGIWIYSSHYAPKS
ncbi:MAG: 16S rRNA (guanine(966)-N(2))-methyltransferase RsmD [Desulfobulbus propionicus]|nr:MAG: 16S rRNA (guanine(966)-N(2))-methyltransferase RsmD [Desulfobulbus propionicus]